MKQTNHKKVSAFAYLLSFIFVVSMSLGTLVYGADNTIQTEKGTLTASADDTYLYLTYEGPWDYNIQERIGISVNGTAVSGQYGDIILNTGNTSESQSLQVRDSWWSPISGASGTVQNSGAVNGTYTHHMEASDSDFHLRNLDRYTWCHMAESDLNRHPFCGQFFGYDPSYDD